MKRGGEGKFRGARPPQMIFPRTAPGKSCILMITVWVSRSTVITALVVT